METLKDACPYVLCQFQRNRSRVLAILIRNEPCLMDAGIPTACHDMRTSNRSIGIAIVAGTTYRGDFDAIHTIAKRKMCAIDGVVSMYQDCLRVCYIVDRGVTSIRVFGTHERKGKEI